MMEKVQTPGKILIDTGKSRLWIIENYTENLLENLQQLSLQEEPPVIIFGKGCKQRRNVGFFSNDSSGYKFSGQVAKSSPLTDETLVQLMNSVNSTLGTTFNGILVNQYINGTKYIGAHSDDENGLDKNKSMVACIAFGATRTFRIRNKQDNKIVLNYPHKSGTLLVMEGNFQSEFKHEIPIQKKVQGERISVTFRNHAV